MSLWRVGNSIFLTRVTVLNFVTTDGKTVLLPKSIWDWPKKSSGLGKSNPKGLDEGRVEKTVTLGVGVAQ